jgi:hypothetical protein
MIKAIFKTVDATGLLLIVPVVAVIQWGASRITKNDATIIRPRYVTDEMEDGSADGRHRRFLWSSKISKSHCATI